MSVNENGRIGENRNVLISKSGYSFGDVRVTVTPLTYSEYEAMTGRNVAELFGRFPKAASGKLRVHQRGESFMSMISLST